MSRESPKKRRRSRRSNTYRLATLGWLGLVVTFLAALALLVSGAQSPWSWMYVALSGLFAVVVLAVGRQHGGVRFGLPLRSGTENDLETNLAVALAVLQLGGGMVTLMKEVASGASRGGETTIIKQRICPERSHFEFPKEHS